MGLREANAARTREAILDAAVALFAEQGFEDSTLEQVAERADVSISTLYRYFPTKDLLVLEPAALNGQMAVELAARPADEALDISLGHAVVALLQTPRGAPERLRQVSELIFASPYLRSRLRDEFVRERVLLQQAIATRLGRPEDDVYCGMTARIALATFELAGAQSRSQDGVVFGDETFTAAALAVMESLRAEPPTIPRHQS